MSMLAMPRGSGSTGLLEQPPARTPVPLHDHPAEAVATAPPRPSPAKSRTIMSTTVTARRPAVPATAVPSPATTPAKGPVKARFDRVREVLFGVGSDRVDIATVQREVLRQPYLR